MSPIVPASRSSTVTTYCRRGSQVTRVWVAIAMGTCVDVQPPERPRAQHRLRVLGGGVRVDPVSHGVVATEAMPTDPLGASGDPVDGVVRDVRQEVARHVGDAGWGVLVTDVAKPIYGLHQTCHQSAANPNRPPEDSRPHSKLRRHPSAQCGTDGEDGLGVHQFGVARCVGIRERPRPRALCRDIPGYYVV